MIKAIQTALAGLQTATQQVNNSASSIAQIGTDDTNEINFAEEAVTLQLSELAFKANVATLKVADELTEELLSIFDETV